MGPRPVPEQPDSREPDQSGGAAFRPVLPVTEHDGAGRKRPVAQQFCLRAEPRVRHVPKHRHQGRSEHQRQDEDVRALRVQQAGRGPLHERHHERTGAGRPASAVAHQPQRRRRLGPDDQLVPHRQCSRRPESVPRARAVGSRPEFQSGRARLSHVVRQSASQQGLSPAELRDDGERTDGFGATTVGRQSTSSSAATAATAKRRPDSACSQTSRG